MKRIAIISYHTCPLANWEGKETGGMNIYVLELGKHLARAGLAVDVFTRSQDRNNRSVVEVEKGFRVCHIVSGPEMPIDKKKLNPYIPAFTDAVAEFARKEPYPYDVTHAHYWLSGLIADDLVKRLPGNPPVVMSFHTLALMKNLVARDESEKEDIYRIDTEKMLAAHAEKIITPSDSDKQYLQYLYDVPEEKIAQVPPGVDIGLFRPVDKSAAKEKIGIPASTKMILFVGRIEPLKGIDLLMYAMKILTARRPDLPVCLAIVGGERPSGPKQWNLTQKSLASLRTTLKLSANVRFLGQQTQEELPYFYNAAELVVMPSHYESFGMVALEAMACGVPVITTDAAGISTLIDEAHANLITSVQNPLILAGAMEKLLTDEKTHAKIASTVRSHVADLSWDKVAQKINRVYDDVSKRRAV